MPTLNAFDVGDGREVVLIMNENDEPLVLRDREGKPGGGEGRIGIEDRIHAGNFELSHRFP